MSHTQTKKNAERTSSGAKLSKSASRNTRTKATYGPLI